MMKKIYSVVSAVAIIGGTVMWLGMRSVSSSVEPRPTVASAVAPAYPVLAVVSNTSGTVEVQVKVNTTGEIIFARSVNGHPLLRQKAEDTAKRWRFVAVDAGTGVRLASLTFVFRIMPKETAEDDLTSTFMPPYQVEVRHKPFEPVVHSDPPSYVRSPQQRNRRRP